MTCGPKKNPDYVQVQGKKKSSQEGGGQAGPKTSLDWNGTRGED